MALNLARIEAHYFIHNLYFNTDFLEACKSCNGRDHNVPKVKAAIQAKEPLKYELVK